MLSKKSNPKPKPSSLPQPVHEWSFEAIGTHWWIGLYEPCDSARLTDLQTAITELIERFDKTYSRFRSDSLVTQISKKTGTYDFPPEADVLFDVYRKFYDASNGKVTPLIGQLLADAGYDADYSLKPGALRTVPAWDDVMTYHNRTLTTTQPILLDFGAAGKGYLVDLIAHELQKAGVERYCVDGSGDMVCYGLEDSLRIGLENPDDPSQVLGVAEIKNGALCGSAGNRRAWADFTHIMDPERRESPKHIKAAWVYAENTLMADGLTTVLYFTEPAKLQGICWFEHCMLYSDGTAEMSSKFPAQLFTERTPHA